MNISEIAKKCKISPSAAYKSLYVKRGVDPMTRQHVFSVAESPFPRAKKGEKPSVGIVLPSTPHYYWNAVYEGIRSEIPAAVDAHFAFFSSMGSGYEGVYAVDYVRDLDICIIAPSNASSVQARIAALAMDKPIVYVSEGLDTPHIATICSNHFDDGMRLGIAYITAFPDKDRILTLHVHNGLGSQMRTNGFIKAVTGAGGVIVGNIELEDISSPFASVIARAIQAQYIGKFDCLYCATGVTPYACLALCKVHLDKKVICIGYENPKTNQPYIESGLIRLLSVSNAFEMGRVACRTALSFLLSDKIPSEKNICIPSTIFSNT